MTISRRSRLIRSISAAALPPGSRPRGLRNWSSRSRNKFGLAPDAEVSLEANPEDWSLDLAEQLVAAGFNRVSFGAQSFDPKTLAGLGRRHRAGDHLPRLWRQARTAGFQSVNLDLIFGSEDLATWSFTLDQALSLEPDHLSCYALTVEPGTELFRRIQGGETGPDPDHQADQWEMAAEKAEAAGLVRYEVSNWARPGHHVRYNLAVWAQGEYLAFGLGAHRFRQGVRSHNFRHLDSYLETVEADDASLGGKRGDRRLGPGVGAGLSGPASELPGLSLVPPERLSWPAKTGERLLAAGVVRTAAPDGVLVTRPLLTDAVSESGLSTLTPLIAKIGPVMMEERRSDVLRALVEAHIKTGEPVSSRAVLEESDLGVSAATIRNDLAALERDGFVIQPHTSAGRIPTPEAYRYYVDHIGPGRLANSDRIRIAQFFSSVQLELSNLFKATSQLLAEVTHYPAVVVSPAHSAEVVRAVHVVAVNSQTLMAVMVTDRGRVLQNQIRCDESIDADAALTG